MRQTLLAIVLFGLGIGGCQNIKEKEPEVPLPKFVGTPADKPVWPDLSGTWEVMRTQPPDGYPEPATPWKRLDVKLNIEKGTHKDENGQGTLTAVGDKPPQFIRWNRSDGTMLFLSVNRAERHVLVMIGDDGWGYLFARTEGGR